MPSRTSYPSMRYSVVGGVLTSEMISGPDQERPGWLESPHAFRALTESELMQQEGCGPAAAKELHQREVRRVALIFAGHSLDEADRLADDEEVLFAEKSAEEKVQILMERIATMKEKFEHNWAKLKAERDALKAEVEKLKKAVKVGPRAEER